MKIKMIGLMSLALIACGQVEESSSDGHGDERISSETKNEGGQMIMERSEGNPADQPGVKVYQPKKLDNVKFEWRDGDASMVTDLDTGDRLLVRPKGHGGKPSNFAFSNEKTGPIADGVVYGWSNIEKKLKVFDIAVVHKFHDGKFSHALARSEYDISSRLAEMLRARFDNRPRFNGSNPKNDPEVRVVDSRPEHPDEIDRHSGYRKEAK